MNISALISDLENESGGRLAFALHDLRADTRLAHRADEPLPTASVIKLPILAHVALAVAEGALGWDDRLALRDAAKVGGSGILKELGAGLSLSLRDLCMLMTALSDNTATNMLIAHVGRAAINARIESLGLVRTRLLRPAFSPDTDESRPYGLGVTTAGEMADLLARLARRQIGDAATAEAILSFLAAQQDRAAIPRLLGPGWAYAGKTGAIDQLRADVGILSDAAGPRYALTVFCSGLPQIDWGPDNPGLLAIARLARSLIR